jgi:hypothetical protein
VKNRSSLFLIFAMLVALFLAGVLSNYASDAPDGLEKAVAELGLESDESKRVWTGAPLADYSVANVSNESLSTGLSGLAGTLLVFFLVYGLSLLARKRNVETSLEAA